MQNNQLTRFDAGGTHESSPLGGVPQGFAPDGNQNTVEQGESKQGNFIYSNRIALDKDLVKQFNLPGYVAGKSVSDASKAIDDKFKDRADKYAQETKKTLLDRLANAQEYLKQQEQASAEQANQSMQANSQEIPDQMNGQIPEGMEEYIGGQEGQEQLQAENIQTSSPIAAFGGYQQKRFDLGGNLDVNGNPIPLDGIDVAGQGLSSLGSNELKGTGIGAIAGAAGTAMSLGKMAFGKPAQDTSGLEASAKVNKGGMIASGAMDGAKAGMAFGAPGMLIGGAIGGLAGWAGGNKAEKAAIKNTSNFALNSNYKLSDNSYAEGGVVGGPGKKIKNPDGSYSIVNTSTRQVTPGSVGTTIPGTPGSPAVLPSAGGVNATDPGRNKAFAQARAAGLPTFNYNGKVYNTDIKLATPGKPAVNPTPATVTPSIPPTYETQTSIEPIPNQVYNVQAQRGTAGTGVLRPGIGGGITTNNQYTANQDVANRALNAQQVYNADVNKRYAPVVDDGRSNNSAQLANRNAKAEIRRQQLQGTATANEIPTQLGLERKKVEALRTADTFAYGGKMNNYAGGGPFDVIEDLNPEMTKFLMQKNNPNINTSALQSYNNSAINPSLYSTAKELDGDKYSLKNRLGRAGETLKENAGDLMRLAPVAMNAYQLHKLKKPQGFQYNTLNNRYKPQYVDEAQMQRAIDQEGNNQVAAISQIGGSEGATRNAILGIGLNKMKGLSDTYANAAAQNRAQDSMAQQFNLGVDSQNVAIRNKAIDEKRADDGAYDSAKSKYLSAIGTDVGEIGKEKNASDAAIAMFGYTRKGKFVVDKDGNKVSPETLARRQADFATYISEQNKKDNK